MNQKIKCNFCGDKATTIKYGKSWCNQCIDEEKKARRNLIAIILAELLFITIGITIGLQIH